MSNAKGAAAPLERMYQDALILMAEARSYIAYGQVREDIEPGGGTRLQMSFEAMRVTARLTEVVSWILGRLAVHGGEICHQRAANEPYRLLSGPGCQDDRGEEDESLPQGLRALLTRSRLLYQRVERLDRMGAAMAA